MFESAVNATTYNDRVVRQFAIMTIVWGVVGMLVGVIIAAQLTWPELNMGISWLSYGRLRPLHTNAVIFAFGGSGLIATSYYVVQRTCHTRLIFDKLAEFTFWGWQAVIVAAAISLFGFESGAALATTSADSVPPAPARWPPFLLLYASAWRASYRMPHAVRKAMCP